jgi:DNA invertase Pin-like site-specific DNA recombinase
MSTSNGNGLDLSGPGAAYVRVSDDQQDTERQYAAVHEFEKRHKVNIAPQHWCKDEGWARDTADRRPDFQRLLKLAERGAVKWIVVSERDRFGTADADEFVHYRYLLRKWGCRLYDAADTEWTRKDLPTVITAVIEGDNSEKEQHKISLRTQSGKAVWAKEGEWQGGPVRLGFDVACYPKGTPAPAPASAEVWRVVFEGKNKRRKVYPDGRPDERFDGKGNSPRHQEETEILRLVPSNDKAKVDAAVSVFERYAREDISPTALASYLNERGWRTCWGGAFQAQHVKDMLRDPAYVGYPAWNRRHCAKFHRRTGGQSVPVLNRKKKEGKNDPSDWVRSERQLFLPLVSPKVWAKVQAKLGEVEGGRRSRASCSAALYLRGLLHCAHCGGEMIAGRGRGEAGDRPRTDHEYICPTYFKAIRQHWREVREGGTVVRVSWDGEECRCLRNAVYQGEVRGYVDRWLAETGRRLELLTEDMDSGRLPDRRKEQEEGAWRGFYEGIRRLEDYLARHHPAEYDALLAEHAEMVAAQEEDARHAGDDPPAGQSLADLLGEEGRAAWEAHKHDETTPGGFVNACVALYRSVFDPAKVEAELDRLRAEYDERVEGWRDLPTQRAKETAKAKLAALEARIAELEQQRQDAAEVVESYWRQARDLQQAIADARDALHGEVELRELAERLKAAVQRIDCTFVPTGETRRGWGKRHTRLAKVKIYPFAGDPAVYPASPGPVLPHSRASSRR